MKLINKPDIQQQSFGFFTRISPVGPVFGPHRSYRVRSWAFHVARHSQLCVSLGNGIVQVVWSSRGLPPTDQPGGVCSGEERGKHHREIRVESYENHREIIGNNIGKCLAFFWALL